MKTSLAQYTGTGNTISSNYSNLLEAVQYFIAKDYTKSATALENVDGKMKMDSESFTSVYNTLNSNLSSKVEQLAFNAGMDAYESADYNEAIKQFTKALDANAENDEAMYYLGYSYRRKKVILPMLKSGSRKLLTNIRIQIFTQEHRIC